jgi:hypothetical protein
VLAHSGACGCKTEAEGKLLALACLCERKSPFEIDAHYHLIGGKLSKKPERMLIQLREAGEDFEWHTEEDNEKEASLTITWRGQTHRGTFSIERAAKAGYVKTGGGWEKNPASMLRARVISVLMRMYVPEISGGYYTPDELEDAAGDNGPVSPSATAADSEVQAKRTRATKAEMEERRRQLQETATGEQVIDSTATPVVTVPTTAPATPATTAPAQPAPFDTPRDTAHDTAMAALKALLSEIGMAKNQLDATLVAKDPNFKGLNNCTVAELNKITARLTANIKAKRETAAAAAKTS